MAGNGGSYAKPRGTNPDGYLTGWVHFWWLLGGVLTYGLLWIGWFLHARNAKRWRQTALVPAGSVNPPQARAPSFQKLPVPGLAPAGNVNPPQARAPSFQNLPASGAVTELDPYASKLAIDQYSTADQIVQSFVDRRFPGPWHKELPNLRALVMSHVPAHAIDEALTPEEIDMRVHEKVRVRFRHHGALDLLQKFCASRRHENTDDRIRLRDAIARRGIGLSIEELGWLLDRERSELAHEELLRQIGLARPQTVQEYAKAFVEILGEDASERWYLLARILQRSGHTVPDSQVREVLGAEIRNAELDYFERGLDAEVLDEGRHQTPDQLTGHEFERYLAQIFRERGYDVEETPLTRDQGADLIISKHGERIVVQAKRYGGKVSNGAVQQAFAAQRYYRATGAMVVATSSFTQSAQELAERLGVELVDGRQLEDLARS